MRGEKKKGGRSEGRIKGSRTGLEWMEQKRKIAEIRKRRKEKNRMRERVQGFRRGEVVENSRG